MSKESKKPSSNRLLFILFIIALPVFILMRWDVSPWLSTQIIQAAKQTGYNINYTQLTVSGLGIQFTNLKIDKPNTLPVQFQKLRVSLATDSLMSGELAANIEALWENNPVSFTLSRDGESLDINHIDAVLDISRLTQITATLPVSISGIIEAHGNIRLNPTTQQLEAGNVNILWNQAKAGLAKPEFSLGDYQFKFYSDENNQQPWLWEINGGSAVALQGNGTISPLHPNPQFWVINGNIAATVDQTNPSLAMMMQTMVGKTKSNMRISGTLGNPRTEMIR